MHVMYKEKVDCLNSKTEEIQSLKAENSEMKSQIHEKSCPRWGIKGAQFASSSRRAPRASKWAQIGTKKCQNWSPKGSETNKKFKQKVSPFCCSSLLFLLPFSKLSPPPPAPHDCSCYSACLWLALAWAAPNVPRCSTNVHFRRERAKRSGARLF